RRHPGIDGAGAGQLQGGAHDAPARRRTHAGIPAPPAGIVQRGIPMNDAPRIDSVMLDPENPWLGLFSYSEATRAYFHGRDEETAELTRHVQRKLLSVLFGQSGLGKTSLLRAGLVPRLRDLGYCPVYVRIDYAPASPAPSEQIKQAVFRATADAGHWTRPGASIEGESLWEFLHHRGDLLRDAAGQTLTPLLIFDQFEEIFTLGQADDAGRLRAKQFLADLADLVENRAPEAPGTHEWRAGLERGGETGWQAGVAGSRRVHRAFRGRWLGTRQRRNRTVVAEPGLPRT